MTREEAIGKWIFPAIANMWNTKTCNEILEALEQEPRWIPVEKMLPEESADVLVWYEYEEDMYDCEFFSIGWQINGKWHVDGKGKYMKVLAWQPLPQPYKAESED